MANHTSHQVHCNKFACRKVRVDHKHVKILNKKYLLSQNEKLTLPANKYEYIAKYYTCMISHQQKQSLHANLNQVLKFKQTSGIGIVL